MPVISPKDPTLFRPDHLFKERNSRSGSESLFSDGRNEVTLTYDIPGQIDPEPTSHPQHIAFWVIIKGPYQYRIDDQEPLLALSGDVLICPTNHPYTISPIGEEPCFRIAVCNPNVLVNTDTAGLTGKPPNLVHTRVKDLYADSPERKFTITENPQNRTFAIREYPGTTSKAHWHFDFDEWWVILSGNLIFEIGDTRPPIYAQEGDIVFTPRGFRHQITTIGNSPSIRMPTTTPESVHIYTDDDTSAPPPQK
jgi:mannose-6-phosphate isomerase-like protein (cupin superfamily)